MKPRGHKVRKHPVGDFAAGLDALHLVKAPMDSKVDATLAILLGGLAKTIKGSRYQWPRLTVLIDRDRVKLVRDNGEMDIIRAETLRRRSRHGPKHRTGRAA